MIKRFLFISPHLDDAVFSCGGLMAMLAEQAEVHMLTCFSASVPEPRGFALACQTDKGLPPDVNYMAIRRKEDERASRILGIQAHYLPLPEAPHRGYHSPQDLFSGIRDRDLIGEELRQNLWEVQQQLLPDVVFYPLGIGNHVDHLQVIEAVGHNMTKSQGRTYLQWYDEPYLSKNPEYIPNNVQLLEAGMMTRWMQTATASAPVGLDISAYQDKKISACAAYATQLDFQFGGKAKIGERLQKKLYGKARQLEFYVGKL